MGQTRRSRKKKIVYGNANREYRQDFREQLQVATDLLDIAPEPERIQRVRRKTISPSKDLSQLVIARRFNSRDPSVARWWLPYLENVSARNPQGKVVAAGEIALIYVGDQAVNTMLQKKYPRAFSEKHKAEAIQRRFALMFRHFVREQEQTFTANQVELNTAPFTQNNGVVSVENGLFIPTISPHTETALDQVSTVEEAIEDRPWGAASFAVRGLGSAIKGYGRSIDLMGEERAFQEFEGIIDYLKHQEGLDTKLKGQDGGRLIKFQPRADFWIIPSEASPLISSTAVQPTELPLHPPAAYIPS